LLWNTVKPIDLTMNSSPVLITTPTPHGPIPLDACLFGAASFLAEDFATGDDAELDSPGAGWAHPGAASNAAIATVTANRRSMINA
jgi:hypothetical protein